ncbi:Superkiller protein 3, partial [Ascosphaera atra]
MEEWETASNIAQKGREYTKQLVAQTSLNMQDTTDALNITLGNALIEHQTPRNHPEARALFEEILERKPILPSCLLGIGLILVEDHDFISAVDFLEKAMKRDPDNLKVRSELYWAKAHNGELEDALHGLEGTLEMLMSQKTIKKELKAELLYRIGYCQWDIDPSFEARTDKEKAYASFLGSAQANPDYAPAYTSLGIFYADYQQDAKRARLCFHRAFELSGAEVEAAERLARDFAEQKEWESVEVIAQRIIDAGRAKPAPGSKRKGHSWPYSALGVVEMSRQQYAKSIVHFQSALRIAPRSYECWVGLGESYHHSGRYGAATRAFQQAELLEPDLTPEQAQQIWFARYMLANVKREVGEYDDAIERYEAVASLRPGEFGVLIGLVQTLTENAQKCLDAGLYGEAAKNAQKAIVKGVSVAEEHPNVFNLWKAIGDAFSVFSWIKGKAALMPLPEFKAFLDKQTDETAFDPLSDIDDIGLSVASLLNPPDVANSLSRNQALYAAILAYKRAVTVSYGEIHAQAVAWYNLGWAEYRAYVCEEQEASSGLTKARKYLKASMRCFKRSIELEAGNSEYWNSLGVVTTLLNPKVAQHSFVRSLHLNDRSAPVWTNLGTLYLLHNDYELASEAFNRAQSADPDYPHPWLGLGLLSLLSGDAAEARGYFTHAFEIGTSAFTMSRRQFSVSVFDHVITQAGNTSSHIQALIQPLLSLHQLHTLTPHDGPYEHLLALFAERVGDFSDASTTLDL